METSSRKLVSMPIMIQSDRYGMETSSFRRSKTHLGFNRTDTEWKLVPSSVVALPPGFNRTDTEWKPDAMRASSSHLDSIGPIRNGNAQRLPYACARRIQSDRYGMETLSPSKMIQWSRIQSDRYGMETITPAPSPTTPEDSIGPIRNGNGWHPVGWHPAG